MGSNNGPYLRLRGIKGFLEGEERLLQRGDEVTLGRSRQADFSVRKATKYLERIDRNEIAQSEAYRTVSRVHARIAFYRPDHIVIEDLSANGTFLDGQRIDGKAALDDMGDQAHTVTLGAVERLRIDLIA